MEALQWLKNNMQGPAVGGSWNIFSSLISLFSGLAVSIILTANLPQEAFGLYKYAYSVVGFFGAFTLSGVQNALIYETARGSSGILTEGQKLYARNAWLFMALITVYAAYGMHAYGATFAVALWIAGAGFIAVNIAGMYGYVLAGKEQYGAMAKTTAITSMAYVAALAGAAYITDNIAVLATVSVLSTILPTIYFHYRFKDRENGKQAAKNPDRITTESRHLTGTNSIASIGNYGDKLLIFNLLGAQSLALYALADEMVGFAKGLIKSYISAHAPRMARMTVREHILPRVIGRSIACGAALSALYFIFAPQAFKYLYGAYAEAAVYTQALSITLVFITPITYMAYVFQSQKMVRAIYTSTITTHTLRIAGYSIGGYYWGIKGIIAAHIAAYAASMVLSIILIKTARAKNPI